MHPRFLIQYPMKNQCKITPMRGNLQYHESGIFSQLEGLREYPELLQSINDFWSIANPFTHSLIDLFTI